MGFGVSGFTNFIIRNLPSSHAVRKAARARPGIRHICRFTDSDEKVFDGPPRPRAGDCEGHYPVERIGATSCGCSGFPATRELRATRLLTGWPRQQQANAMAIANLDGFCHGQAWPTLRGRQPRPSREERRIGLKSEPTNGDLTFPHENQGSARN